MRSHYVLGNRGVHLARWGPLERPGSIAVLPCGTMKASDEALIGQLRAALGGRADLRLAVLFGSMARGQAREDSDVDVAIESTTPLDELALTEQLARVSQRRVDLVHVERADSILKNRIAREGIVLAESEPGRFARFAAEAALEYLDLEPLLVDGRRRYLRRVGAGSR